VRQPGLLLRPRGSIPVGGAPAGSAREHRSDPPPSCAIEG